jgi:predicted TIM-barrel fold metal-dependent hydrolase
MAALLQTPLPALNDPESDHVPELLPGVIDAHVHLFPDHLFKSVWQWFDRYGWPIRYRLMYGSDFPNLPYAWDREILRILRQNLKPGFLSKLLGDNAAEFYGIRMQQD